MYPNLESIGLPLLLIGLGVAIAGLFVQGLVIFFAVRAALRSHDKAKADDEYFARQARVQTETGLDRLRRS